MAGVAHSWEDLVNTNLPQVSGLIGAADGIRLDIACIVRTFSTGHSKGRKGKHTFALRACIEIVD